MHIITTIDRGGAENQLLALSKVQAQEKYSVLIVPLKGSNELERAFEALGVSVYSKASNKTIMAQLLMLISKTIKFKPSIIHGHLPRAELIGACLSIFAPLVVSRHNSERFFPKSPKFISQVLSRFVSLRAKGIVFISHAVQKFCIEEREVLPHNKNQVIHYGIDSSLCLDDSERGSRPSNGKVRFITVGRLVPQKDIFIQIEALSLIRSEDVELVVIGDGELRESLTRYTRVMGLEDRIEFLGRTDQVQKMYREADCFILSSRYEGFGLVLLEAVCAKIPIIASAIPTTKEILGDDFPNLFESGNAVDLANTMNRIIDNQSIDSARYRKVLSDFDIHKSFGRLDGFYSDIQESKWR